MQVQRLSGIVLEAADLAATRAFYEPIFTHHSGTWEQSANRLLFSTPTESVEFVRHARPRTYQGGGYHQAYRVPAAKLKQLAQSYASAGSALEWWREDHPDERVPSPYLEDPSGNRVQLVASDQNGRLIDHVAVEVYEFDYCEYLWVTTLGGNVQYYHGWRREDQIEAKQWASGDDPCAPWTRKDNPSYRDFLIVDPVTGEERPARFAGEVGAERPSGPPKVPRPNGQVFYTYGDSRLALISATRVWQEQPEEIVKSTPRLVFDVAQDADAVAEALAPTPIPWEREGNTIYVRDADGNFAELRSPSPSGRGQG
ncbi:MAG TPA: VOC family protein [Chloroflexota bacterium]